jgi:hypothetical protein
MDCRRGVARGCVPLFSLSQRNLVLHSVMGKFVEADLRTVTGRALIDLRQLHFDQIKLDGGLVTTAQHSSDGTARQRAA